MRFLFCKINFNTAKIKFEPLALKEKMIYKFSIRTKNIYF